MLKQRRLYRNVSAPLYFLCSSASHQIGNGQQIIPYAFVNHQAYVGSVRRCAEMLRLSGGVAQPQTSATAHNKHINVIIYLSRVYPPNLSPVCAGNYFMNMDYYKMTQRGEPDQMCTKIVCVSWIALHRSLILYRWCVYWNQVFLHVTHLSKFTRALQDTASNWQFNTIAHVL